MNKLVKAIEDREKTLSKELAKLSKMKELALDIEDEEGISIGRIVVRSSSPTPSSRYSIQRTRKKHHIRKCEGPTCGRNYKGFPNQRFCSRPCCDQWWHMKRSGKEVVSPKKDFHPPSSRKKSNKALRGPFNLKCKVDNKPFTSNSGAAKYCSTKCQDDAAKLRWAKAERDLKKQQAEFRKPTILIPGDSTRA